MRNLTEQLSTYASYHRDRRNIATHFVGVPMIVVAIFAFLARPSLGLAPIGPVTLTPALVVLVGGAAFYLALDLRFGLTMLGLTSLACAAGGQIASSSTGAWLAGAVGLFVVGWVIQFVGHAFEGKKPAFVDDLVGLLIGPLFVVAEAGFALGLRPEVREAIEAVAGPTHGGRTKLANDAQKRIA
jgi:uncharacterized membrane protein YGL010W